jgi:hypothetical protein
MQIHKNKVPGYGQVIAVRRNSAQYAFAYVLYGAKVRTVLTLGHLTVALSPAKPHAEGYLWWRGRHIV